MVEDTIDLEEDIFDGEDELFQARRFLDLMLDNKRRTRVIIDDPMFLSF